MAGIVFRVIECQMETKTCLRCHFERPEKDFQLDKRGRRNVCKECRRSSEKLLRDLRKKWSEEHPGQTPSHCECCGKSASRLVLDHCHDTGEYRGWLCDPCNIAIGNLGDTLEGVGKALKYLSKQTRH